MFNSYYEKENNNSQKVVINTPSSIAGTLIKSNENSKITAVKINSPEFNDLFKADSQIISYTTSEWYESAMPGHTHYKYDTKHVIKVKVLQTMLANDGIIFVEYIEI